MAPLRAFFAPSAARRWRTALAVAAILIVAAIVVAVAAGGGMRSNAAAAADGRLPRAESYMSLLALGGNPETILLGTGSGVYASHDDGVSWKPDGLDGMIVMNLILQSPGSIWAAGHQLLARSSDNGSTWADVNPAGLPHHDVHAFAADPRNPDTLWAWLAAVPSGFYRSTDGGHSFSPMEGQATWVEALTILPQEQLLVAMGERGLWLSTDDARTWKTVLKSTTTDIAVDRGDPSRILAAGAGVQLSTDAGRTWKPVLNPETGTAPVSWSASNPRVAYAGGARRSLYRSVDGGVSWNLIK